MKTTAREKRYERLIRALNSAVDALRTVLDHEGHDAHGREMRVQWCRDLAEYAGYLGQATWWRERSRPKPKAEKRVRAPRAPRRPPSADLFR